MKTSNNQLTVGKERSPSDARAITSYMLCYPFWSRVTCAAACSLTRHTLQTVDYPWMTIQITISNKSSRCSKLIWRIIDASNNDRPCLYPSPVDRDNQWCEICHGQMWHAWQVLGHQEHCINIGPPPILLHVYHCFVEKYLYCFHHIKVSRKIWKHLAYHLLSGATPKMPSTSNWQSVPVRWNHLSCQPPISDDWMIPNRCDRMLMKFWER